MTQNEKDQIRYQYQRLRKYEELERTAGDIEKTLQVIESSNYFNINWGNTISQFLTENESTFRIVKSVFDAYVDKCTPQIKELVINNLKQELESVNQEMKEV